MNFVKRILWGTYHHIDCKIVDSDSSSKKTDLNF